ncbi:hypothetical protein F8388_000779 [Cannabis sativa]|uniref:Peroxidase n=1 Tax=Cannabis sativa TaxID=3483 RepID=A0A7J6E112_CANSA|nr:hypothetical protein F8388_000779 [Cannabis sativa]
MGSSTSSNLVLMMIMILLSCVLSSSNNVEVEGVEKSVPLKDGLSWQFYAKSCPNLEFIIREQLIKIFKDDIAQAAGLLRLHFHDCFVQSGGPIYAVPLGRRDGLEFATLEVTLANLPPPTSSASAIVDQLATNQKLDPTDVVALSGGHTIGIAHCPSFGDRLYPNQDSTMDQNFAKKLKGVCPKKDTDAFTFQDILTPNIFDNKYYIDLMNRQGLFTSDQDLFTFSKTKEIVKSFAINQWLFFEKFVIAMTKMGQLNVLTGNQGEIRANCSVRNPQKTAFLASVVENGEIMTNF